jgi:hypothetical protein
MQLQKTYRRFLNLIYLDKNNPPPRWMVWVASVYLGMMLFLVARMFQLV